jgi:DNA-binding transcriptional MerR regulator
MKISEVSNHCGVSTQTLRYYEQIGLFLPITRKNGGIRDLSELDVPRVEFIKCMRSAGFPIEVIIKNVGLVHEDAQTIEVIKEIIIEQRKQLLTRMKEMQETLDLLDYKISVYENAVLKREQEFLPIED